MNETTETSDAIVKVRHGDPVEWQQFVPSWAAHDDLDAIGHCGQWLTHYKLAMTVSTSRFSVTSFP